MAVTVVRKSEKIHQCKCPNNENEKPWQREHAQGLNSNELSGEIKATAEPVGLASRNKNPQGEKSTQIRISVRHTAEPGNKLQASMTVPKPDVNTEENHPVQPVFGTLQSQQNKNPNEKSVPNRLSEQQPNVTKIRHRRKLRARGSVRRTR